MNFDTTIIIILVSFILGLLSGISLIRPRYRHYADHYPYERHPML